MQKFDSYQHGNKRASTGPAAPSLAADPQQIAADTLTVIAEWYHYGILELMKTQGFSWEPKWIGARLGISSLEISAAIERLERVGLLKKTETGFEDSTQGISTDVQDGLTSAAHRRFQQVALQRAYEAVQEIPLELRDNSSMILALDLKQIPLAKSRFKAFRRALATELENGGAPTEVYQISLSLTPLSKVTTKAEK